LQQNAFDPVDEATPKERQIYVFNFIYQILETDFSFTSKDEALHYFQQLRQLFKGWNSNAYLSAEFKNNEAEIRALIKEKVAAKI
jgi:V/A-type H+-transporting ATPase subunit A